MQTLEYLNNSTVNPEMSCKTTIPEFGCHAFSYWCLPHQLVTHIQTKTVEKKKN